MALARGVGRHLDEVLVAGLARDLAQVDPLAEVRGERTGAWLSALTAPERVAAMSPVIPGYVCGGQPGTGSALLGSPGTVAFSTVKVVVGAGPFRPVKRLSPVQYRRPGSL